jgi:hypothetical protein
VAHTLATIATAHSGAYIDSAIETSLQMLAMIARKDNIANTSVNGAYVLGELSTLMQNDTQCVGSPFVLVIPWSK